MCFFPLGLSFQLHRCALDNSKIQLQSTVLSTYQLWIRCMCIVKKYYHEYHTSNIRIIVMKTTWSVISYHYTRYTPWKINIKPQSISFWRWISFSIGWGLGSSSWFSARKAEAKLPETGSCHFHHQTPEWCAAVPWWSGGISQICGSRKQTKIPVRLENLSHLRFWKEVCLFGSGISILMITPYIFWYRQKIENS